MGVGSSTSFLTRITCFSQMTSIKKTQICKYYCKKSIQNISMQINSTQNPIQSQSSYSTETQVKQKHSQAIANQKESIETHIKHNMQTINTHVHSTQSIATHNIQHTNLAHVSQHFVFVFTKRNRNQLLPPTVYPSIAATQVTPNMTNFSFWSMCILCPKYSEK